MKIAVLDDWAGQARALADWATLERDHGAEVTVFTDPLPEEGRAAQLAPFDVLCVMRERTPLPATLLAALPRLRLIVTTGMRNNGIDIPAAQAQGITVCGTRSRKTTTSELTLALLLAQARRIGAESARIAGGGFQGAPGRDLAALRVGLAGLGNVGGQMARLMLALGAETRAWSPNLDDARAAAAGVGRAPTLEALAACSDVLSLHLVLSERTAGLVGARVLAALPRGAIVVNTSRAGLLDRDALFDWLEADPEASAAIDVFETEPLPAGDPWRRAAERFGPRLLLTPHLGYVAAETWKLFYADTVEAVAAWASGSPVRCL